jgi:predicted ATPase
MARYVLDMIEKRAAERPQLIALEDVHWADGATLEVLAHLLSIVTHHRLLLVMTVRDQPPIVTNRIQEHPEVSTRGDRCDRREIALMQIVRERQSGLSLAASSGVA